MFFYPIQLPFDRFCSADKWQSKKAIEHQCQDLDTIMNSRIPATSKEKIDRAKMAIKAKGTPYPIGGVCESSLPVRGTEKNVEKMLSDIVTRLERIEEKIDENVYPPESAIKPSYVKRVKKAQADIAAGKGKTYKSMDDFIRAISE